MTLTAIRRLLGAWLDPYPMPTVRSNPLCWRQTAGVAPSRRRACPSCAGQGKLRRGRSLLACLRCSGQGQVTVDPYTGEDVQGAGAPAERLRCLSLRELDTLLARVSDGPPDMLDALASRLRARSADPAFAALERAMDALGLADPAGYMLVRSVYVTRLTRASSLSRPCRVRLVRSMLALRSELLRVAAPPWAERRSLPNRPGRPKERSAARVGSTCRPLV